MAKKKTSTTLARNPLATPGGQKLDPAVRAVIAQAAVRRGGDIKTTIRLPVELANRIYQVAEQETGNKKRGFSNIVVAFLEEGLEAYDAGRLKLRREPVVVQERVVRQK